ncbi:MAG: XRE family transcriptional regulator [Streptosporangiales bacterium]|nr:XRE family transcriptional regulator [Streptosporangiales bacterium]
MALADVVEQVCALYEAEGRARPKLGETLLSAYEGGHKRPGREYLHYLCAVYHATPEELGYDGPCICGHDHRGNAPPKVTGTTGRDMTVKEPAENEPWAAPSDGGADGGDREDNVLRRTLLQLLAGSGVAMESMDGQFFSAIEGIRRRMDDTLVSATVSPTMLDQWEETTASYGRQYMSVPPLRLLCDVLLDFSDIQRMVGNRQPTEIQERLCRLAAQLSGITGILMIDLGDHRLARSFFRTSRTAADDTGDRALRSWVAVREAVVPLYYGDPREAVQLARKGRDLAGRTQCAAAAMAPLTEARALGALGQGREHRERARRAVAHAQEAMGHLPDEAKHDTAFGYTDRQFIFHTGDAFVGVGEVDDAHRLLADALDGYAMTERLDRTLIRFAQARAHLATGEVEQGLKTGLAAINELPDDHRTDIVLHRARQLGSAAVAQYGEVRAAREYREALALPAGG